MKYSHEEIQQISESLSVLDYFKHLERQGKVKLERKTGHDHYFKNQEGKYSVTDKQFYNFKTGDGGKILKAVMTMENKSWIDALNTVRDLAGLHNIKTPIKTVSSSNNAQITINSKINIQYSGIPNNDKLLSYFEHRGISRDIVKKNTNQIHYENNKKKYFGIGLNNLSGGYEIRNPMLKTKIGKNDISLIKGNKNEIVVFEGMMDALSFLQLQKMSGKENNRTLAILNSVTNTDKFLSHFQNFTGKILLCLDGDKAGDYATEKIFSSMKNENIKDIRQLYGIHQQGNKDLNDYLLKKLENLQINLNFKLTNTTENDKNTIESSRISNPERLEQRTSSQQINESRNESKSKQNRDNEERLGMGSNDVGNGSQSRIQRDLGRREERSTVRTQQNDASKDEKREYNLEPGILNKFTLESTITSVIQQSGAKVNNENIKKIVDAITYIDNNKVHINEGVNLTDEIKDFCSQYKSGGISKSGRGVLDEYYTDKKIVDVVRNLIKDNFNGLQNIRVLEPSVGTGNFIDATKDLPIKSFITAFEINETTARIAKILHPDIDINLRSFETEFIDENGIKKNSDEYQNTYDLVIGNPPYGEHRGLYKGLGEESKISKYEDYFVKRSLDVLKENGTLAMVLPSSWLSRQKKLENAELINAFRLPSGAFSGTQVGTDIIILKKNSLKKTQDISKYFENNPEKILGELKEKTNRFGRLEPYVNGTLDDALSRINELQQKKEVEKIGNLFEEYPTISTVTKSDAERKNAVENDDQQKENHSNLNDQVRTTITEVLDHLNGIKFKTPAIRAEIKKYIDFKENLPKLSQTEIQAIQEKSEKILQINTANSKEYQIQSSPEIKSKFLKYQFIKDDHIVPSALQNNSQISEELIRAFKDTNYDGTLNNYNEHYKFANYIDGKWVHDFYYAEGNIYDKLEQLENDFTDKSSIQYEKQKALLKKVLPKPKTLDEIIISPNHEFVHKFDLGYVDKERWNSHTRRTENVSVQYNLAEMFKDFVRKLPSEAFGGSSSWEVSSFVDNENVTGSDKERNALIRERRKSAANDLFGKFIREELSDEMREKFVHLFNRNYNNIYVPDYSKFPLFSKIYQNFKGKPLNLTEVQKAGIGRLTTKGVGLLAHEVGFGKTLSGILSMHEAMERGLSTKPLIVVPNQSILKQWVDSIFEVIPNAKVNVLGNLGKDYDLSNFNNKEGEITIVTYEGFNNIGFSKEKTEELASKFSYISTNELKRIVNSERDIQKEIQDQKEIEGKMRRGKVYDWEDFGFDHLTFDEVHNANHIVGKVKIEDRRFASDFRNQNQQTSKLGMNTWMAAQYIQDQHNGRNISLLSATPFTNKPLEYYSVLSLIANDRLEKSGYFNVNTFFETFMEADNDMEIDAKGDVKFKANVRRFKNNSLFQQLLSEFIDVKGEEDNLELVRPNRINKEYKIEQNDLTKEQYNALNKNFSETEKGAILTHILNGRLIAISPYLSPYYEGELPSYKEFVENSPKLNETMNLIRQNKKDIPNSGQIIYSELAVSEFPKLKDYLVKDVGYKDNEIEIITGATSKTQRMNIQADFNAGKIKVIIGSEAIQEGMNLQENTTDMYLLSLPYNFTTLRQIEGRAWRQGNKHENVRINFMLTNDSIDVFMLQKLQSKQARYLEAMKKGANVLDISDINTQELKTSIITNPETRANIEVELLKKRWEAEKNKYSADSAFVLRKYEDYLKVKQKVIDAETKYNRILGYSKDEDSNAEYWTNQLPYYQKGIENAKEQVEFVIKNLAEKGVNVEEIEMQQKATDLKIEAIDKKIEELPIIRNQLVTQYQQENEARKLASEKLDIVKERANENINLFKAENRLSVEISHKLPEQTYEYQGRKR